MTTLPVDKLLISIEHTDTHCNLHFENGGIIKLERDRETFVESTDRDVWVKFAAHAISRSDNATAQDAASLADQLLKEYLTRYGAPNL